MNDSGLQSKAGHFGQLGCPVLQVLCYIIIYSTVYSDHCRDCADFQQRFTIYRTALAAQAQLQYYFISARGHSSNICKGGTLQKQHLEAYKSLWKKSLFTNSLSNAIGTENMQFYKKATSIM